MTEHTDGLIAELRDFPFFVETHNGGVRFIGLEVLPFRAYIPR
jgi:hypothetical protein